MEKFTNSVLKFHKINEKKLGNWLIEAIQMNDHLGLTDQEITEVVVETAKNWNDRVILMTHDNFLLAVDAKLRQKYASKIETQEYRKGNKTEELVYNVKKDVNKLSESPRFLDPLTPLTFDPEEVESNKPVRGHDF